MIREYIENDKFNSTYRTDIPAGNTVWLKKGAIRCNGVRMGFAAWSKNKIEAENDFQTYLDSRCICVVPTNKFGQTPPCPVHGNWTKELDGIEYWTNGAGI